MIMIPKKLVELIWLPKSLSRAYVGGVMLDGDGAWRRPIPSGAITAIMSNATATETDSESLVYTLDLSCHCSIDFSGRRQGTEPD